MAAAGDVACRPSVVHSVRCGRRGRALAEAMCHTDDARAATPIHPPNHIYILNRHPSITYQRTHLSRRAVENFVAAAVELGLGACATVVSLDRWATAAARWQAGRFRRFSLLPAVCSEDPSSARSRCWALAGCGRARCVCCTPLRAHCSAWMSSAAILLVPQHAPTTCTASALATPAPVGAAGSPRPGSYFAAWPAHRTATRAPSLTVLAARLANAHARTHARTHTMTCTC